MPSHARFFEESGHRLRDWRLFLPNPTFGNPSWEHASFRVLIVRLSPHRDVDRSTGHLALAREARRGAPGCWLDFAFLPVASDRVLLEAAGLPLLVGTQSHRSLDDFDLALLSNACLPELVNFPALLARSGIPAWAHERDERWPPMLLGGSNAAAAHALVAEDGSCMADALFFGEAEGELEAIVRSLASSRGRPKRQRIAEAADRVTGLWPAGDLARTVQRAVSGTGLLERQADPAPVLPGPEATTARLEITRGCPCRCSFCFEGLDRLPYREVGVEELEAASVRLRASTGASTLELSSLNFTTHAGIAELLPALCLRWPRVNPMSQRADFLARWPELVELEIAADKRTFTLGIEGISASLRAFLHKSLSEADLAKAMELLHRPGVRELKLFYLITGREEEADFAEFSGALKRLKELRQRAEAAPRLVFSFGMLVRMPFTPLRHDAFPASEAAWRRLVGKAKSACETHGFEFRLAMGWLDWKLSQVLARADRQLHGLLLDLSSAGIVWDHEFPPAAGEILERWMAGAGISFEELGRELPSGAPFPMPQLAGNPTADLLWRRFVEAKEHRDDGYGGGARGRTPEAAQSWRGAIRESTRELSAMGTSRRRPAVVRVLARVPVEAAGLGLEWLDAWLTRELLAVAPGTQVSAFTVREALVRERYGERFEGAWHGVTVAAVTGIEPEALIGAIAGKASPFETSSVDATGVGSVAMKIAADARHFPQAAEHLQGWLRGQRVPATFLKAPGGMRLEVPPAYVRKRALQSASWREAEAGLEITLAVGDRFDLAGLLASLGAEPAAARRALVEITAVNPSPPASAARSPRGSSRRSGRR